MGLIRKLSNSFSKLLTNRNTPYASGGSIAPLHRNVAVRSSVSSFASSAFNRIAVDVSMVELHHVKMTADGKEEYLDSELNDRITLDANIDQTSRALLRDIVYSMFDEGVVAVVPISVNGQSSLRVGRITQWYPDKVRVEVYDETRGIRDQLLVDKDGTAIIENPLYAIINGPNTTLRRLIEKMNQIDQIDSIATSGQLDVILQLPFAVKTDLQKAQAEARTSAISEQLQQNRFGVAYVDATERITQLNRPVTDTILPQIDKLSVAFYNQLGLTENVMNGTASESEMLQYYARTIDVIVLAITEEFTRKFLEPEELARKEKIVYYRDPFKLVPIEKIPDIIDKTSRNEILSPNEGRKILGFRQSSDPEADVLKNRNMAPKEPHGSADNPDDRPVVKMNAKQKKEDDDET